MTETATSDRPLPQVTDRATSQARIDQLRVKEKVHTRAGDALAAERRRLPMVEVDPTTSLIGADGAGAVDRHLRRSVPVDRLLQMWHTGRPAAEQCEGCTFSTTHYETYWTTGRGNELMAPSYGVLDLTVYGRQELWGDSPEGWPQRWGSEGGQSEQHRL